MIGIPHAAMVSAPDREASVGEAGRSRAVAVWLMMVALAVLAMVVVGGATRLTGSGLSITQWKPLSGALPPLDAAAWDDLFRRYQATPQYKIVNAGMSLAAFKSIFWWEWAHRLLGRGVGLLFAAPLAVFLALRKIPRRLIRPCLGLLALGALQGLVGWWMVRSGLEARTSVAPERLATHLGLALLLFCALIWTALEAWSGEADPAPRRIRDSGLAWTRATAFFAAGVFLQCLAGAVVAGNHAGLANADWPLMSGRAVPVDYWQGGPARTLLHGLAATQFDHRLLAYALAAFGAFLAVAALRSRSIDRRVRIIALIAAALVAVQIMLGVAVLWSGVPVALAMTHQLTAALLLASAVALAWTTRRYYVT